jgi:menaquinone-dependent protoporphyrinogen oxidase
MKTLIAYATKYGTTREIAYRLSDSLQGTATLYDVADAKAEKPNLADYDLIVLGSAVYAGNFPKPMGHFILGNIDAIAEKKLAMFLVGCMKTSGTQGLAEAMPEKLRDKILKAEKFGGAFHWKKLSLFERFVVSTVMKVRADFSNVDWERVAGFAQELGSL